MCLLHAVADFALVLQVFASTFREFPAFGVSRNAHYFDDRYACRQLNEGQEPCR